jgi:8-oxo-dGTP diphosphatase
LTDSESAEDEKVSIILPEARSSFLRECDYQDFVSDNFAGRGAVALVLNPGDELLMMLRDDMPGIAHPNKWSIPGGGCEPGEDERETICRELMEEVGIPAAEPLEAWRIIDRQGSGQLLTSFIIQTRRELKDMVLNEGQELRFFAISQIPALNTPPFVRSLTDAYYGSGQCG